MTRTLSRLVAALCPIVLALVTGCQTGTAPEPVVPGVRLTVPPPVAVEVAGPMPPSMVPGVPLRTPAVDDSPVPARPSVVPGVHLRTPPVPVDALSAPAGASCRGNADCASGRCGGLLICE
jgi:hypothetical protein